MCDIGYGIKTTTLDRQNAGTGFRWCEVGKVNKGVLFPLTNDVRCWQEPIAEADPAFAQCSQYDNGLYASGGLHAFSTLGGALDDPPSDGIRPRTNVLMKVRYWGKTHEHAFGTRSQFAQIVAILVPWWKPLLRRAIRKGNPKLDIKFVNTRSGLSAA